MGNLLNWIKNLFKKKRKPQVCIYSKELMESMKDTTLFERFAEPKTMPQSKGKIIKVRSYNDR